MYLSPHRVLNICIFISLLKNLNLEKNLNEQQQHFVCLGEIDSTMATDVQLVLGHIFLCFSLALAWKHKVNNIQRELLALDRWPLAWVGLSS